MIDAFVDQHGSCSWREYDLRTGGFRTKRYDRGSFGEAFAGVLVLARPFAPPLQPNLTDTESGGLPEAIVRAARNAAG
jgi:hypothetical protein